MFHNLLFLNQQHIKDIMVEKFLRWFFTEVDMYGPGIHAGIFGDYIIDKILNNQLSSIFLYVYSDSPQWENIKESFVKHIEEVWNIFQHNKIQIIKFENLYYHFSIYDVHFRIYWEKPWLRQMFTYQSLQYTWANKKFTLSHNTNHKDPLYLLKILNHIKKKKLVPIHPKNFVLDHNYFIADRVFYLSIVDTAFALIKKGWFFDNHHIRLHPIYDSNMICSICRNEEDMSNKLKIKCGHAFHKDCLDQLMSLEPEQKHSSLCPNCRSPIQIFYN